MRGSACRRKHIPPADSTVHAGGFRTHRSRDSRLAETPACCAICCVSSPRTGILAPPPLSRKCVSAGIGAQSGHYEDWLSGLIIPWSCVRITPGLLSFLAPFRRSSRHLAQVPLPHGLRATVAKRCDWGRLPAASSNASCARRLARRAGLPRRLPPRSGRPGLGCSASGRQSASST